MRTFWIPNNWTFVTFQSKDGSNQVLYLWYFCTRVGGWLPYFLYTFLDQSKSQNWKIQKRHLQEKGRKTGISFWDIAATLLNENVPTVIKLNNPIFFACCKKQDIMHSLHVSLVTSCQYDMTEGLP